MIAVLLCAGYGTRMHPLTRDVPKPLLEVADRPVLDYLMDDLCRLDGLRHVHVVINTRFFHRFRPWQDGWLARLGKGGPGLTLHDDGSTSNENRLGACADLKFVLDRVGPWAGMLVSGGDNIYRFDIAPLWELARAKGGHHIVALPEPDDAKLRKTGVPLFGEGGRVLALHEKPEIPPSRWCCPPLYFLAPSAAPRLAEFLQASGGADAPGHFIDYLCRRETVHAFKLNATRLDIGSLEAFREADRLLRKA